MNLILKNTFVKEDGKPAQTFSTDNPRIREVTFVYGGTEDDLNALLKGIILDYLKDKKLVD